MFFKTASILTYNQSNQKSNNCIFIFHVSFVIVLISKGGYLKTTENKSSCELVWVACKKNDLTEKSFPNRLGLEPKRMQGYTVKKSQVPLQFFTINLCSSVWFFKTYCLFWFTNLLIMFGSEYCLPKC